MSDLKQSLKTALEGALQGYALPEDLKLEISIQETPADKPGDYGSAVAFQLGARRRCVAPEQSQVAAEALDQAPTVASAPMAFGRTTGSTVRRYGR